MSNFDDCIRLLHNKFYSDDMRNLPELQIWHLIGHIATDRFNEGIKHGGHGYEPIGIKVKGE